MDDKNNKKQNEEALKKQLKELEKNTPTPKMGIHTYSLDAKDKEVREKE